MTTYPWEKLHLKLEQISKICAVITAVCIPISTTATDVFLLITIILNLVAGGWQNKSNFIFHNRIAILLLVFFALFVVGITYSSAPTADILKEIKKYDKFLFCALLFPIFAEEKYREYTINGFIIGTLILLLATYLKAFGWIHTAGPDSVFKGHIEFSFLSSFAAYICLINFTDISTRHRWIWIVLFAANVYALFFLSISRSGYLTFVVLMLLFTIQVFRWKGLWITALLLGIALGIITVSSTIFTTRMREAITEVTTYHRNVETSLGERIDFYRNSLSLIKSHPVIGTGTGSFSHEYANIKPTPKVLTNNPHNEYINITIQFGIVGLAVLLLLFGSQIWESRKLPPRLKRLAQAIVIAIAFGSTANSWLLDSTEGHFFTLFSALTFAALPSQKRNGSPKF